VCVRDTYCLLEGESVIELDLDLECSSRRCKLLKDDERKRKIDG